MSTAGPPIATAHASVADASAETERHRGIRALEVVAIVVLGAVVAVVMNLGVATHIGNGVRNGSGDEVLQAWQVAWGGHALSTNPAHFFDSNSFWPLHDSLAFSDALIGFAPIGMIGHGAHAALVRYNLLFLFSYMLAFVGTYLLARELSCRPVAALIAACAFAFAPARLLQTGHLHVLTSGGVPLSLFLLYRGARRQRPWLIFAGWVVAAWQVAIGFAVGLQLAYLLALLVVLAAVWWAAAGRPALPRACLVACGAGLLVFVAWSGFQAKPYLDAVKAHPEAKRSLGEVGLYSAPPRSLLSAPKSSWVWGHVTAGVRDSIPVNPEKSLFPGLVVTALALLGLILAPWPRWLRAALAAAAVLSTLLAFGTAWPGGHYLYGALFHMPGWQGVRSPTRIEILTSLALGLLAAGAVEGLLARFQERREPGDAGRPRRRLAVVPLLAVVLASAVAVEGLEIQHPSFVPTDRSERLGALPNPQLHLPSGPFVDGYWMFWSVDRFPRLANGYSGFAPTVTEAIRADAATFPDAASVAALRRRGIRTVILHISWAAPTAWKDAASRPTEGLPLTVERRGSDVIIYRLR